MIYSDTALAECDTGESLRQNGDFRGAIEASEKALTLRPGMGNAYDNLGLALRGESQTRVPQHNVSQRHAPSNEAKDHYDAGSELLSRGEIQGAEKEFEKAVEADLNWAE